MYGPKKTEEMVSEIGTHFWVMPEKQDNKNDWKGHPDIKRHSHLVGKKVKQGFYKKAEYKELYSPLFVIPKSDIRNELGRNDDPKNSWH